MKKKYVKLKKNYKNQKQPQLKLMNKIKKYKDKKKLEKILFKK